jgi:predicted YcjX-like family ATPase
MVKRHKWPLKTKDFAFFRCRFERPIEGSVWEKIKSPMDSLSDDEIEFFDFPGERVADVTMFDKSFAEWSDTVIRGLNNDPHKAAAAEPFFEKTSKSEPTADGIVDAWKLTLGDLILNCHALITPSTFLIDADKGQTAMERIRVARKANQKGSDDKVSAQELKTVGCSGLPGQEFAPLPVSLRNSAFDITRRFSEAYEKYQERIVRPFAKNLLCCHALIFLVDISDVLGSGVQKLNDTEEIIEKLMEWIERGRGFLKSMCRGAADLFGTIIGGKWGFTDRIAFVASKADKIHDCDRNSLELLLRDLSIRASRGLGPSDVGRFLCKSVNSTISRDGRILQGRPIRIYKDGKLARLPADADEIDVSVPELPREWPDRWDPEAYQFTDFHPKIPAAHRKPPEQAGLDAILRFALDL